MSDSNSGCTIGPLGALFLVFLVLKLTDNIDWSWWWVTAPLWGLPALLVVAGLGAIVFSVVVAAVAALLDR